GGAILVPCVGSDGLQRRLGRHLRFVRLGGLRRGIERFVRQRLALGFVVPARQRTGEHLAHFVTRAVIFSRRRRNESGVRAQEGRLIGGHRTFLVGRNGGRGFWLRLRWGRGLCRKVGQHQRLLVVRKVRRDGGRQDSGGRFTVGHQGGAPPAEWR